MNKNLRTLTILFFALIISHKSYSQCTPNPNDHTLITPDTVTNFASGTVGVAYSQIVYLHPPIDTTVMIGPLPIHINPVDSVVLINISNLPPGLSLACNPSNCVFPGGVSGCANISGTPTTAGNYILDVIVTAYGKEATTQFAIFQTDTVHAYHININTNSGIAVYDPLNFQLIGFGVDPVKENINIKINSPKSVDADLSVFNIIGKSISSEPVSMKHGMNIIDFSTKSLSPGVYILTLKKDPYLLTRRFVIGGK